MERFLTDENIPPPVIQYLKNKGFDVRATREFVPPGSPDANVIGVARQEERILLTFDKHFANILLYPLRTHAGIIRIRLHPSSAVDGRYSRRPRKFPWEYRPKGGKRVSGHLGAGWLSN